MRKCREQCRGTATHRLIKCLGPGQCPSFFQNRFHVLHIIFMSFVKKRIIIFLDFALIQVLTVLLDFWRLYIHFTVSRACPFWPEGRYPTGRICSNGSSFLSIISDVSKEYSTRTVRRRKYRQYWDTFHCSAHAKNFLTECSLVTFYIVHWTQLMWTNRIV